MILRLDRLGVELPPPSDPDPAGAQAVQELLGGKFGEMSTWLNYTFQSFNFRVGRSPPVLRPLVVDRDGGVRPCRARLRHDQQHAHRCDPDRRPRAGLGARDVKGVGNPHHFLAGGQGALPQNSQGRPWNGDYIFSSGDLVEDLTHNFFLETGARNNKLKVYEMVEHPAARALTGYLLVRGGVHQVAYARAIEHLTGASLMKMFPTPRIATDKIRSRGRTSKRASTQALPVLPGGLPGGRGVWNGEHPETGDELVVADVPHPVGAPAHDLPPQPAVFAPDYAFEEIAEIAQKLRKQAGLPDKPTGLVSEESDDLVENLVARTGS